jgi:hypothetical protein
MRMRIVLNFEKYVYEYVHFMCEGSMVKWKVHSVPREEWRRRRRSEENVKSEAGLYVEKKG